LLTERLRERQQRKKDKASDSLQAFGVESPPLWITEGNPVIPTTPKAHQQMWLFFIAD